MKHAWIAALMIGMPIPSTAEGGTCPEGLTVREYNLTQASALNFRIAHQEVSRLFHNIGISIRWEAGDPADAKTLLLDLSPPNPRHPEPAHPGHIVIEIVSDRQTRLPEGALGMSFPSSREGVQVIIASDRIEQLRAPVYMANATIMGCVMAHEIAHVLLRSATHSRAGIMRAKWDKSSYQLAWSRLFAFSKADAAALRAAAQYRQELACGTLYSKYPDE